MKKILLFIAAVMVAMSANAAYYLRGELAGSSWDPGIEIPNGTITFDAESGVNYEFKVTEDPSAWTGELGFGALAEVPQGVIETGAYGGNIGFSVPSAGQVTIKVENGVITLTSTVGFGEFVTPEWDGTYYIAGTGVEGSGFCCDLAWNEKECPLTNGSITYAALPAGDYAFKITDGTWTSCWGYTNLADPSNFTTDEKDNNILFTLEEASSVTISFDGTSITVTIGAATEEPEEPTAIDEVDAEDAVVAAYDLLGRPVAADAAGYVILQYASGKAAKVFNN